MLSFRRFISLQENLVIDNPGGDWEKGKQRYAEELMKEKKGKGPLGKGLVGDSTARTTKPVKLSVDSIKNARGSNEEHEYRHTNDSKTRQLEKDIGDPSNFDTQNNPIEVRVNHKGEPFIHNGNHRLEYAKRHGITHIHANIQYHAGGENADGPLHPKKLGLQ